MYQALALDNNVIGKCTSERSVDSASKVLLRDRIDLAYTLLSLVVSLTSLENIVPYRILRHAPVSFVDDEITPRDVLQSSLLQVGHLVGGDELLLCVCDCVVRADGTRTGKKIRRQAKSLFKDD